VCSHRFGWSDAGRVQDAAGEAAEEQLLWAVDVKQMLCILMAGRQEGARSDGVGIDAALAAAGDGRPEEDAMCVKTANCAAPCRVQDNKRRSGGGVLAMLTKLHLSPVSQQGGEGWKDSSLCNVKQGCNVACTRRCRGGVECCKLLCTAACHIMSPRSKAGLQFWLACSTAPPA